MSSYQLLFIMLLFLLPTLPISLHKSAIFFLLFRSIIFVLRNNIFSCQQLFIYAVLPQVWFLFPFTKRESMNTSTHISLISTLLDLSVSLSVIITDSCN